MYVEKDLIQMDNLLKCVRQGKFDLNGEEALAFASMFTWAVNHRNSIKSSLDLAKQRKEVLNSINVDSPNKDVAKESKPKSSRKKSTESNKEAN